MVGLRFASGKDCPYRTVCSSWCLCMMVKYLPDAEEDTVETSDLQLLELSWVFVAAVATTSSECFWEAAL